MLFGENLLNKNFKDHTVQNPIDDLSVENLPTIAYDVHNQPIRNIYATIQILDDKTNNVLETISGKVVDGTLNADSDALIRRTLDLEMMVSEDTFPGEDSLIWFNKKAKVYMGISQSGRSDNVINFLAGTFWVSETSYAINDSENVIDVKLEDKMGLYHDMDLEEPIKINPDTPIDVALRTFMEHIGENDFGYFEEVYDYEVVPYTLEFKVGESVTKVIKTLRDMYMDYTCGYDVQGRFEFRRIEQQREEDLREVKWRFDPSYDENSIKSLLSFSEKYDLKSIRNRIVVYGATSERSGTTAKGESRVTDAKSPFNVFSIGERTKVLINEKLATNDQCVALARYEILKSSNFQEVCVIRTVPLYLLDLYDVISVKHPETNVESKYIIDSFSFDLGIKGSMVINAHKLYYVSLEYGAAMIPLVEAFVRGIYNHGWISLAEERISRCYNMVASGEANLTVRFQENISGGEQMSVTSYPTTKNQTLLIDLADYENMDLNDPNGFVTDRSRGDSAERVTAHEMFHAVMNDYVGHERAILIPTYFIEGFAEFIHGAKERFLSVYGSLSKENKKNTLIELCENVMNGNFVGTSEDYVASYLIAIAIYRKLSRSQFNSMFYRVKTSQNIGINFLSKVVPIADTDSEIKQILLNEIRNMDSVWQFLFDKKDKDTGSIGGIHFMNLYNRVLDDESIFNNIAALDASIGFKLQIVK